MLKSVLLGGAMLLALPALAQTASSTATGAAQSGPATTTSDQDPALDDPTVGGSANTPVSAQVDGNVAVGAVASPTAPAQAGIGGPEAPRDYPVCSRTVTDSCLQLRSSPRPPGS
jgi:hypothetical protein